MTTARLLLILALVSVSWALQGDFCDDPIVIDTLPVAGLPGNSMGFANDFSMDLSCTGEMTLGPDVVYEYTTEVAGEYSAFLTISAPWNGAIYVLTDCYGAACVAGSDNYGIMSPEVVVFNMPANTTFWVVVDGRGESDAGTYYFGLQGPATSVSEEGNLSGPEVSLRVSPNPFRGLTEIGFALAEPGPVEAAIYSKSGSRVRTLLDQERAAGEHTLVWDGKDDSGAMVPEGVYFLMLCTPDREAIRKIAFIK